MWGTSRTGSRKTGPCYIQNMSVLSVSTAIAAELCACLTLLPGFSVRERLVAFIASAVVLGCTLLSVCRIAVW